MSLLGFGGEDPSRLSSVMHIQHLQPNFQPRLPMPSRLLVKPLVLRWVRLCEASEDVNCRFSQSMFSMDYLIGSNCILLLCLLGSASNLLSQLVGFRSVSELLVYGCKSNVVLCLV